MIPTSFNKPFELFIDFLNCVLQHFDENLTNFIIQLIIFCSIDTQCPLDCLNGSSHSFQPLAEAGLPLDPSSRPNKDRVLNKLYKSSRRAKLAIAQESE